jgi:hypothetical protein
MIQKGKKTQDKKHMNLYQPVKKNKFKIHQMEVRAFQTKQ